MKKFLSILFFCMYTMAVSGMVIQLHYCGGELESWQIASNETKECCCISDSANEHEQVTNEDADDCCANQEIKLQIDNDYNVTIGELSIKLLTPSFLPQNTVPYYEYVVEITDEPLRNYQANAPPGLWQNIPLFSLNQSRLLYDVA